MMGTPGNSRRRIMSREMSDDENMMIIIREADAKFNARRVSFAEAKEACTKKLVQQQQENIHGDLEDKYMDAVQSIDLLETEKTLLVYEVERLRDILESTEEELAELQRKHTQMHKELETEKVAKHLLQQKITCMQEQLEERQESHGTEIIAIENTDKNIQSNLQHKDAKKMEFKSDKMRKHCVEKLQGSAVTLQDIEFKLLVDDDFETKSNKQQSMKIIEDISNGNDQEGIMNIFIQQGADDTHVEESNDLVQDSEKALEGYRSETLEQLELLSKEKDPEYQDSNDCKEKEQNKLIVEVSEVTSGEAVHKGKINEEKSEGNEDRTKEEISNEGFLSNGMEGGERKQFAYEAQSQREEKELDNEHLVKNEEIDRGLHLSVNKVNEREDSRTREEQGIKEEVNARESLTQKDNKDRSETNSNLDMRKQQTVTDGQVHGDGEETQNGGGAEQNTGGKEKGAFEMLEQLFKKVVIRQKSLSDSERQMNKENYIDSPKDEISGERGDEIKEQDEEYVLAKQAQYRGNENKGRESISVEIEEETNELCRKELANGGHELLIPERKEAMTELIDEAAQLVTDLSNEEIHNSVESTISEQKMETYSQESKTKNEQDPENTTTSDDVELRNLNASESIKRHLKHSDTCLVS
ncbi:uncharacterized protein [Chiloscyllium punctatum]|uniref:uncharacterized protein isoform X1 n=2 Tax=Chiloscyllium punctatum TaxID=137246 RepID=UPI003B63ACFD